MFKSTKKEIKKYLSKEIAKRIWNAFKSGDVEQKAWILRARKEEVAILDNNPIHHNISVSMSDYKALSDFSEDDKLTEKKLELRGFEKDEKGWWVLHFNKGFSEKVVGWRKVSGYHAESLEDLEDKRVVANEVWILGIYYPSKGWSTVSMYNEVDGEV